METPNTSAVHMTEQIMAEVGARGADLSTPQYNRTYDSVLKVLTDASTIVRKEDLPDYKTEFAGEDGITKLSDKISHTIAALNAWHALFVSGYFRHLPSSHKKAVDAMAKKTMEVLESWLRPKQAGK
jgi:NAD(P)H-dependent FMN reductase